jgi:hypothetical protein
VLVEIFQHDKPAQARPVTKRAMDLDCLMSQPLHEHLYPLFKNYYLFTICIICDICNCVRSRLGLARYSFPGRAYRSA